ncbi:MAG: hypothetical protein U0401_18570 [Anaerolineae bacterium]
MHRWPPVAPASNATELLSRFGLQTVREAVAEIFAQAELEADREKR